MQEINLYRLLQYYAKNWLFIALLTLFGFLAGFAYTNFLQTPLYKSNATLILVAPDETKNTPYDTTLINNYIELMKSRRVLEPVIAELQLDMRYDELAPSIEASSEEETEVIKIAVSHANPEISSKIADTTVMSFKREVGELYNIDNLEVVDNANLPDEPYNVRTTIQLVLGAAAGFFSSLLILFFVYDFKMTKRQLEAEARHIQPLPHTQDNKPTKGRKVMRSFVRLLVGGEPKKK